MKGCLTELSLFTYKFVLTIWTNSGGPRFSILGVKKKCIFNIGWGKYIAILFFPNIFIVFTYDIKGISNLLGGADPTQSPGWVRPWTKLLFHLNFRRGLVELFGLLEKGELMEGPKLSSLVTEMHKYRQGAPRKRYSSLPGSKGRARARTEESFYENPFPECICLTGKH